MDQGQGGWHLYNVLVYRFPETVSPTSNELTRRERPNRCVMKRWRWLAYESRAGGMRTYISSSPPGCPTPRGFPSLSRARIAADGAEVSHAMSSLIVSPLGRIRLSVIVDT
jgi:hypothetical protein